VLHQIRNAGNEPLLDPLRPWRTAREQKLVLLWREKKLLNAANYCLNQSRVFKGPSYSHIFIYFLDTYSAVVMYVKI
jgi:hypothetical protein